MPDADALKNVRVVLCETRHPGNIGAASRAMKTMGLGALHLVRPHAFPDPRAEWLASRAADVLKAARVHDTLPDALRDVSLAVACSARMREVAVPALPAREAAARAVKVAVAQEVAFVFGNETNGLTTADVNRCQLLAYIPADPGYTSLNLAAAVQVFAYELRMAAGPVMPEAQPAALARHEDVEAFYAALENVMTGIGFLDPAHPGKLMPRLRRLFGRAGLEPEEVNILRGLLKAISRPPR